MYPIILLGSEDKKEPTFCEVIDFNKKVWKGFLYFSNEQIPHFTIFNNYTRDAFGTCYGTCFLSVIFNPISVASILPLSTD